MATCVRFRPSAPPIVASTARAEAHHKSIVLGAIIILLMLAVALLAPVLSPYGPNDVHPLDRWRGSDRRATYSGLISRARYASPLDVGRAELARDRLAAARHLRVRWALLGSVAGYLGGVTKSCSCVAWISVRPTADSAGDRDCGSLGPSLANLVISLTNRADSTDDPRVTYQVVVNLKQQAFRRGGASGATMHARSFSTRSCPNSLGPTIAYVLRSRGPSSSSELESASSDSGISHRRRIGAG